MEGGLTVASPLHGEEAPDLPPVSSWVKLGYILHHLGEYGELLKVTKSVGAGLCLEQCDFVIV